MGEKQLKHASCQLPTNQSWLQFNRSKYLLSKPHQVGSDLKIMYLRHASHGNMNYFHLRRSYFLKRFDLMFPCFFHFGCLLGLLGVEVVFLRCWGQFLISCFESEIPLIVQLPTLTNSIPGKLTWTPKIIKNRQSWKGNSSSKPSSLGSSRSFSGVYCIWASAIAPALLRPAIHHHSWEKSSTRKTNLWCTLLRIFFHVSAKQLLQCLPMNELMSFSAPTGQPNCVPQKNMTNRSAMKLNWGDLRRFGIYIS